MRVRVSLDFDILLESFISLCIIETVGAIFREYKSWIVLLITRWSKSSKILALSLLLFDLQGLLSFIIRCTEVHLLGKQGMISCTWMKHGSTKITAQIICGFRIMGPTPQKIPSGKGKRLDCFACRYTKWGFDWRFGEQLFSD
jgi:hypothetical protein